MQASADVEKGVCEDKTSSSRLFSLRFLYRAQPGYLATRTQTPTELTSVGDSALEIRMHSQRVAARA